MLNAKSASVALGKAVSKIGRSFYIRGLKLWTRTPVLSVIIQIHAIHYVIPTLKVSVVRFPEALIIIRNHLYYNEGGHSGGSAHRIP